MRMLSVQCLPTILTTTQLKKSYMFLEKRHRTKIKTSISKPVKLSNYNTISTNSF